MKRVKIRGGFMLYWLHIEYILNHPLPTRRETASSINYNLNRGEHSMRSKCEGSLNESGCRKT